MSDTTSVLIVEDNVDLAAMYATWTPDEWAVETVTSGDEAVPAVDETVDVVVLDRRLPGYSGDEVLERLRDQGYDCQVVIVTAVEPDFDIVEMGFDDYLVKPVDRRTFERTLDRSLQRTAYDRELREYYAEVAKLSVLQARKSEEDLADADEYERLRGRVEAKAERADALLDELLSDPRTHPQVFRGLLKSATQ